MFRQKFSETVACAAVLGLMLGFGSNAMAAEKALQDVRIYGYLEMASLPEGKIQLRAKLDTGADNSSVHAPEREFFKRGGEQWIRFDVKGEDGGTSTFERQVVRIATIAHRTGPNAERPVVMLELCVGDRAAMVEVNLADRTGLEHPMLIGRSFLDRGILVNSAARWTAEPSCSKD